ncbi:penicillin-binding protein [Actinoplanes solisilvae]|uniref:penicillin-binding protein n=1 Tax=Actinoplanes solisilvae TaxID=2486853 RepID=UPI000FDA669D|nr:transglycosylase domain-containing protein [Actinoplanes solisilvae]
MSSWFRRRDHNVFFNVFALVTCGGVAGVVVAAAAFPVAAMSGLTAKAGNEAFASLPGELKDFSSPQISRVYAADNRTQIAQFYDEFRSDVPLKDMSKSIRDAMVAAEDREFYKHNGVDLKGIARAVVNNSGKSDSKQGASTITMQWVRMSLVHTATSPQEVVKASEDTNKRKITEIKYAMRVEQELSKDQILERYLNIAPFGKQTFGIFAASKVYFNKRPKDLTVGEAALLAAVVRAPSFYDPTTRTGYDEIRQRRNAYVIPGMLEMGAITPQQAEAAKKEAIPRKVAPVGNGCVSVANNSWGFFCDYFYRWWMERPEFGATTYERDRRLKSGGYRITTTIDLKATKQARGRVADLIAEKDKNALLLAAVEPRTGKVRMLVTNRKYSLNNAKNPLSSDPAKRRQGIKGSAPSTVNPLISGGGDITGYQAGSVMKIFTLIAALEKGYPLRYTIKAEKYYKSKYIIERSNDSACPGTHFWCPQNSGGGGEGIYNMWTGFGRSINTFFVPLEERVGAENVVDVAKRFGIKFRDKEDAKLAAPGNSHQWGAFTLGVSATTPLDMAGAYATLAADGLHCEPTPIEQITTRAGENLDLGKPRCERATSPDVARAALDAARCPVGDNARLGGCAGATAPQTRDVVGHPVFGKTGTTDRDRTASLIAGTTSLVVAGYLVNPDYQAHKDRLKHAQVNPAVYRTLADYMEGRPSEQFKRPENRKLVYGDQRRIPDVECDSIGSARDRLESAGFMAVTSNSETDSNCPAGTAAGTSPSGRTVKGGVVTIEVSNGKGGAPTIPGFPPGTDPPRRPR